ncbi:MAG: hypothetical protein E6Q36_02730 [Chryseobacterium sp.]|nr:MAG: hypothetical protein E6Q36_02730 [Chryseobacterium sp.]
MNLNFKNGQSLRVTFDDSNPHLNNQKVTFVRQLTTSSPFWMEVEFQGEKYSLRESSVYPESDPDMKNLSDEAKRIIN